MTQQSENRILSVYQGADRGALRRLAVYVIGFLVVVAEVSVMAVVVPPKWAEVTEARVKVDELKVETDKMEKTISVLESLDQVKVRRDLATVVAALPNEKKVTGMVTGLTNLASASGVSVSSVELIPGKISTKSAGVSQTAIKANDLADVDVGGGVRGIPLSLVVSGNEPRFLDLVGKIARVSPLLGVRKLDFTVAGGVERSGQLTILVYFMPVDTSRIDSSALAGLSLAEEESLRRLGSNFTITP